MNKLVPAVLLVLALAAGAVVYWRSVTEERLPEGITWGNGRLEAEEIDVGTKFPGRVAEVLVEEGDLVEAGQVVARMDTHDLEADLRRTSAMLRRNTKAQAEAEAQIEVRESACELADKRLERAEFLVGRGHVSEDLADERRAQKEMADAACDAAKAHLEDLVQWGQAIEAEVARVEVDIAEADLQAPRDGRVQYRLAEPGEVLPAGGRVITMIDLDDMYMVFFLSELDAGRTPIGAEARIVLDAFTDAPVEARVTFIAAEAQFTPKEVETLDERQKMVFRAKAQVMGRRDPRLKPGLPGVTYVRFDESVPWPEHLE